VIGNAKQWSDTGAVAWEWGNLRWCASHLKMYIWITNKCKVVLCGTKSSSISYDNINIADQKTSFHLRKFLWFTSELDFASDFSLPTYRSLRWEVRICHAIVGAREDPQQAAIGSTQATEHGQILRNKYTIRWKVYNLHLSGHITMRQIKFDENDRRQWIGCCTKDVNKIAIRVTYRRPKKKNMLNM